MKIQHSENVNFYLLVVLMIVEDSVLATALRL